MAQDWFTYLQQLHSTIQSQQQQLQQLQEAVQRLTAELEGFKRNLPQSIGKIEYKFDQLKVENLNGTLNIGLNPFNSSGQAIEDFDVDTETLKVNPEIQVNPDFYQDILQQVARYLNEDAYSRIIEMETEQRTALDDTYRQMMIDDIQKQMEHRLPYYLSQVEQYPEITSNPQYMKEIIVQNMKKDIDQAFLAFIQHIPQHIRKE
jgi:spore germination protein PC